MTGAELLKKSESFLFLKIAFPWVCSFHVLLRDSHSLTLLHTLSTKAGSYYRQLANIWLLVSFCEAEGSTQDDLSTFCCAVASRARSMFSSKKRICTKMEASKNLTCSPLLGFPKNTHVNGRKQLGCGSYKLCWARICVFAFWNLL